MHGQVEPEAVELAFAAGDPGGQLVGVLGGGFHVRVEQSAFLFGVAAAGFELGELPLEAGRGGDRVDRLDMHADVHPARVGQQGLQPSGIDLAGESGDGKGSHLFPTDLQVPWADGQRIRGERPGPLRRSGFVLS
ncbi:hypothetical protein [Streptomyces melanosporofaciens]|uniref:hypothetical protein n=1 Tax=Streptomyces melanosporofaciens TaxID=67327 RepID=UPI001AD8151E|nr:hypothetical protein [Streptomyces melanosporofaciens]